MADSPSILHGTPVDDGEDLYRALTIQKWWKEEENCVSTAAFKFPLFSVDVARIAKSREVTLKRFRAGTGLVSLNPDFRRV